jgi:hypothetical protein
MARRVTGTQSLERTVGRKHGLLFRMIACSSIDTTCCIIGLPGGTRTPYPKLRRLVLYPDELRAEKKAIITRNYGGTCQLCCHYSGILHERGCMKNMFPAPEFDSITASDNCNMLSPSPITHSLLLDRDAANEKAC